MSKNLIQALMTLHLNHLMKNHKDKNLFNGLLLQILENSITPLLEEKKTLKTERNSVDGPTHYHGLMMVMMMTP